MFPLLINPLSLLLTLSTAFGVLVHDTQLDTAAKTALTVPIAIVAYGGTDMVMKMNDQHIHNERVSLSQSLGQLKGEQPRTQTRGGDDKKYFVQKKSSVHSYGSEYVWPSI
ncbi:hypothetical protein H7X69_02485 [Candidatus Saccharibacteria bacterium]|nr:hypothetical protein [Candidatus Saccharibacteria bacterium]